MHRPPRHGDELYLEGTRYMFIHARGKEKTFFRPGWTRLDKGPPVAIQPLDDLTKVVIQTRWDAMARAELVKNNRVQKQVWMSTHG